MLSREGNLNSITKQYDSMLSSQGYRTSLFKFSNILGFFWNRNEAYMASALENRRIFSTFLVMIYWSYDNTRFILIIESERKLNVWSYIKC